MFFAPAVLVLVIFIIIDYITGIIKLYFTEQYFSRKIGIIGAIKKLLYGVLVLVGFLTDYFVTTTSVDLGLNIHTKGFISFIIVFYLISNEGLSILKNLKECGVPMPKFLINIFEKIRYNSN